MSRGGKREGAGRPVGSTTLSEDAELWVGSWCELFWRRLWKRKQYQMHRAHSESLDSFRTKYMPQSRPRRDNAMTWEERERAFLDWMETPEVEDYLAEYDVFLEELQGRSKQYDGEPEHPGDPKGTQHYILGVPPKPQGVQTQITLRAQKMVLRRYGVRVSTSLIDKYWKDWRRFVASF